jgi:4'-phosphopantetheinyl transferase
VELPPLAAGDVQVWWAERRAVRGWHHHLLDRVERGRHDALRRQPDRDRFVVGCAVLRLVAAAHLRMPPEAVPVQRDCPGCGKPHGKTRVAGLELSLSHSGEWVVVAVSRDLRVGVDIEHGPPNLAADALADHVLAAAEHRDYARLPEPERVRALLGYWVGKEAVLKATGDGLRLPPGQLTLTGPAESPRLVAWEGRPELAAEITLHPLRVSAAYTARLAVIGRPAHVAELDLPWRAAHPPAAGPADITGTWRSSR